MPIDAARGHSRGHRLSPPPDPKGGGRREAGPSRPKILIRQKASASKSTRHGARRGGCQAGPMSGGAVLPIGHMRSPRTTPRHHAFHPHRDPKLGREGSQSVFFGARAARPPSRADLLLKQQPLAGGLANQAGGLRRQAKYHGSAAPRSARGTTSHRPTVRAGIPWSTRTSRGSEASDRAASRGAGGPAPGTASAPFRGHRSSTRAWAAGDRRRRATWAASLNDFIRPREDRRRDGKAESLGGP